MLLLAAPHHFLTRVTTSLVRVVVDEDESQTSFESLKEKSTIFLRQQTMKPGKVSSEYEVEQQ